MSEFEEDVQLEDQAAPKEGVPFWSKIMVAVSVLFLVVGFSMKSSAPETTNRGTATELPAGSLNTNSLVASDGAGVGDGTEVVEEDSWASYSPFFIKGGFSFLIAFCVGLAVRMFFKVTAIFVGVLALCLFALNKVGWVDVDWTTISDQWDRVSGTIAEQASGLKSFITGSLPAAGMGSLGLIAGFKKG
ncbi:MAG: hypothetical protein KDB61_07900 [Planctomycetes bacterium]|nr:hypothetical protein [Planctomycetota bacterium]